MAANFEQTTTILADPGAAEIATVGANVDSWIDALTPLGAAGQPIVDDLTALKAELTSDSPDGATIGQLMASLGSNTSANAGGNADLAALGSKLSSYGA